MAALIFHLESDGIQRLRPKLFVMGKQNIAGIAISQML
jgi:hypothetical protein